MAPLGWSRLNGRDHLDGVAAATDAGARWYLDKPNKQLVMYPHADGTGDYLSMVPVGLVKNGPVEEINAGWRMPIEGPGNQYLYLVDFQLTKLAGMLDHFLAPGLALVIGGIPVSEVPSLGNEWRPECLEFGGPLLAQSSICPQLGLDPDTGLPVPQNPGLVGSLSFNNLFKQGNDGGKRRYECGKYAHAFALAIGYKDGQITGWAFGRFDPLGAGRFDKVFDINAQFQADMTRNGIGNPTTLAVSADLGYTTEPGTATTNASPVARFAGGFNGVGDVTLNSVDCWTDATASAQNYRGAIYAENSTPAPATLIADTGYGFFGTISSKSMQSMPASGTPAITLSDGTDYTMGAGFSNGDVYYDTVTAISYRLTHTAGDPWPASTPTVHTAYTTLQFGIWIDYTAAASPPVTTNANTSDATPAKGESVTLTATITDGDNPTTAWEWFVGADPGEGNGTAGPWPGGSSPFSVSDTVDTSSLPYANNTISVRGYNATEGWGAVDTTIITVWLTAPTGVTATGVTGETFINLSWDDNTDAAGYLVYASQTPGVTTGDTELQADDSGTYQHTGLTADDTWYYRVGSQLFFEAVLFSDLSDEVSAVVGVVTVIEPPNQPARKVGRSVGLKIGGKL